MTGSFFGFIANGWYWWSSLFTNIPLGDPFVAILALMIVATAGGFLAKYATDFANSW